MAITYLTPVRQGFQWLFQWASDLASPTYYVWLNGEYLMETLETSYLIYIAPGDDLQFSVFDSSAAVPPEHFPSRLTLRWMGRDGAQMYRVEQYVNGEWLPRGLVPWRLPNVYHYQTARLDDVTEYQYRAVPLDAQGRAGTALTFTVEMVRYPDPPAQTIDFTGGELVIT